MRQFRAFLSVSPALPAQLVGQAYQCAMELGVELFAYHNLGRLPSGVIGTTHADAESDLLNCDRLYIAAARLVDEVVVDEWVWSLVSTASKQGIQVWIVTVATQDKNYPQRNIGAMISEVPVVLRHVETTAEWLELFRKDLKSAPSSVK